MFNLECHACRLVGRALVPLLLSAVCLLIAVPSSASADECGHSAIREAALKADPTLQDRLDLHEESLQNSIALRKQAKMGGSGMRSGNNVRYIPVVFHVLFENADENITDSQILSQLNVLNEDFRRIPGTLGFNTHPDGADICLEFRLTDTDPDGNPTTGINRVATSVTTFEAANPSPDQASEGGVDPWNVSRYLNIIVCDLPQNLTGFSRGVGIYQLNENRDVVVVDYEAFGDNVGTAQAPRVFGRNGTHEVGHHLDLLHTFEGNCISVLRCSKQGDKCCDTPKSNEATYGCPSSQERCNRATQTENYMDYTDDVCRNMFTNDQSDRMNALLDDYRADLVLPGLTPGQDFFVFGEHIGNYNYVSTSRLIAHGAAPYAPFFVETGNTIELRARTEVVLEPGFDAEGADVHIFVEQTLPLGKRAFVNSNPSDAEPQATSPHAQSQANVLDVSIAPQPFAEQTQIQFRLERSAQVSAAVYDVHGRRLVELMAPSWRRHGRHSLSLNASDLPPAVYILNICVDGDCQAQPLMRIDP